MEMFEIYNGSKWAHDIFLVNKAGAKEYITGRSYPLNIVKINVSYFTQQVLSNQVQKLEADNLWLM